MNLFKRKKYKIITFLLVFVLGIAGMSYAGEITYPTWLDGDVFVDIMITNDTGIALNSENVTIDFSKVNDPYADVVSCDFNAEYIIYNSDVKEVTFELAKADIIKVKSVSLTKEELEEFDSGARIIVNGDEIKGMLYAGDTVESIVKKSIFDTRCEALYHYTYQTFLNEAIFAFGGKDEDVLGQKYDGLLTDKPQTYYYEDPEGEERLCAKVFKVTLGPGRTAKVNINQTLKGELNRQNKYTNKGGTYTYAYNYGGIPAFYSVGEMNFSFELNDNLPIVQCDVPRFLDDDVWTIKNMTVPKNFTFTVGKQLTNAELNDIKAEHGPGKIATYIAGIVGWIVIIAGFAVGGFIIVSRYKSGIRAR